MQLEIDPVDTGRQASAVGEPVSFCFCSRVTELASTNLVLFPIALGIILSQRIAVYPDLDRFDDWVQMSQLELQLEGSRRLDVEDASGQVDKSNLLRLERQRAPSQATFQLLPDVAQDVVGGNGAVEE